MHHWRGRRQAQARLARRISTRISIWRPARLDRRKMAKRVFAIPPNSAASERVFSLHEAMFGKDQDSSLSDMIQGALMLRYNKRTVG